MAYNPYLPIGYGNNYPQSIPMPQAQAPQQQSSLIWVQGESGAKSYMVPANSTVMLMDSESERFFIKSTDVSGMPAPLRIFEFKEVTSQAPTTENTVDLTGYVTKEEFNRFKAEMKANGSRPQQKKGRTLDEQSI